MDIEGQKATFISDQQKRISLVVKLKFFGFFTYL